MEIFKFGGTSLASSEAIRHLVHIIKEYKPSGEPLIVVVSALNNTTDKLNTALERAVTADADYLSPLEDIKSYHKSIANDLFPGEQLPEIVGNINLLVKEGVNILNGLHLIREITPKAKDQVLSIGERISAMLIAAYMQLHTKDTQWFDATQLIRMHAKTREVDLPESRERLKEAMENCNGIGVMAGYIAGTTDGTIATLGRGGSDYTAALAGEAMQAAKITIWTDVDGIYTTNPRIVPTAFSIKDMTYEEALELSHFGAQVLYPPTILPALRRGIPIHIKNAGDTGKPGTRITTKANESREIIKGLSYVDNMSILLISGAGMVGVTGTSSRAFSALSKEGVNVVFVSQSSSEHSICVGVSTNNAEHAVDSLRREFAMELDLSRIESITAEDGFSVIALVGNNMSHTPGVSGKMFDALGRNGINIHAIAQGASERNISAMIKTTDAPKALNVLHEEFFLSHKKHVHVFIAGTGTVGQQLMNLFEEQHQYLNDELDLVFRLIGVSNSRKQLIGPEGISWEHAMQKLNSEGETASLNNFVERMHQLNMRNTIFVDNTASEDVSQIYETILGHAISIATCNKISASSSYARYAYLKEEARRNNVQFLYETNVGAGLPLLSTLHDLLKTGDKIRRVEAVLSGSMNYIFNQLASGNTFYGALKLAMDAGFTEPDPREDLYGTDVKRKILIIAREAGYRLELEDIVMEPYLPEACYEQENLEDFMQALHENQHALSGRWEQEIDRGNHLRMMAVLDQGKARIEIQSVSPEHPAYDLRGADNIILLHTRWYKDTPLVIQGAGAGAEVTASGVMNDVIKIANV